MPNDNISLLYSQNYKDKMPLLINILEEYGLRQKKRVYLQSFDVKASYYVNHLLSLISKINFKVIDSYMFPLGAMSRELKNYKINAHDFIMALETIRKSNIVISSFKVFNEEDWLDYIFDLTSIEPYQVIIIDNFDKFIEKSNQNLRTIKKVINSYAQKYQAEIILFSTDIKKYNHSFKNWKVSPINDYFIFEFDQNNHQILSIDAKEKIDGKNRI